MKNAWFPLFLIGWLAVCSESATWTVGGGGGSDFETLSAALGAASASDTLLVAPGVYDTTAGEIFPLPLSDGVAIIAASSDNRPRVVGDREHPVIRCERVEGFLLDGLVIEGGGGLDGAGISCATSVGTIRNCRIEKNFYYPESEDLTLTLGRGVFLDSSAATLRNCRISENRGPGLPMSIFEGGGMVCFGVSSATLEGCTITENHNDGIRFFASGDLTLINSLIAKTDPSTPQSSGSGLAFFSEGICRIQSSSIVGHLTGGISVGFGGTCEIKNSIVWNLGTELNGEGYIVDHSCIRGGHEGEGNLETYPQFVAPANGDWRLSNGSPCIDSGESSSLPAMDLDGADRVRGNEIDMGAYESPEDFEPLPSGEPPTKLYVARTATGKSGDSWEDPLSTLYEALLRIAEEGEIWIRSGKYPGGFLLPGNIDLIGGFAGHEQTPEERDFSTGSTILEATGSGTTVLTAFRDDSFIMDGLTLAGGSSPGSGGGLYGQSCAGRISDCTFISNSAYDRGAGAYLTGSGDFVIERCSFLGNTSAKTPHDSEGGGLYSSPTSGSSLTLRECVFRNNGTITEGAAILAAGSNSHLSIEDCLFEENFYVDPGFPRPEFSVLHRRGGASTRVINTVFRNNRHVGQFNFSYLYTWTISTSGSGGTTSFEHCDIVDNIGLGGLRLGSGVLSDCLIERNEGAGVSGGELLIEDCRIADHAALGVRSAGQDSVTVISRCTIENNGPYVGFSPTTTPGGLDLSGSSATILDSFILNNVGTNGAAGGIDCGARQLILRNSVIAGNSATGTISTTGGIFFRGENLRIDNCSFNGNRAFRRFFSELTPNALGAALASDVQVANSIIWDGTAAISANPETAVFKYCALSQMIPNEGNLFVDPQFLHPWDGESADLRLPCDSPCVDAGTIDGAPSRDIEGVTRPRGSGIDMGAYENCRFDLNGDRSEDVKDLLSFPPEWYRPVDETNFGFNLNREGLSLDRIDGGDLNAWLKGVE